MTIASVVIVQGYRENNLIPVGSNPSDNELAEALALLNSFVNSIFGFELGENFVDWPAPVPQRTAPMAGNFPQGPLGGDGIITPFAPSTAYPYPPTNSRVIWGNRTFTLYFPEAPNDGARMALVGGSGAGDAGADGQIITLDGNGRFIEGANTVTVEAPLALPKAWFYRADLANWILSSAFALTDQLPFPAAFDDFFSCALSIRLAPRYNKTPAASTLKTADLALQRLKARYRQSQLTTYGSENFPKTDQSFANGRWWC